MDARNIGGAVSQSQADDLRTLCDETNSDRGKFLAFAGAKTFEEIPVNRIDELTKLLNRKRSE